MDIHGVAGFGVFVIVGGGFLAAGIAARNLPSLVAGTAILGFPLSMLAYKVAMYAKPHMQQFCCPKTSI